MIRFSRVGVNVVDIETVLYIYGCISQVPGAEMRREKKENHKEPLRTGRKHARLECVSRKHDDDAESPHRHTFFPFVTSCEYSTYIITRVPTYCPYVTMCVRALLLHTRVEDAKTHTHGRRGDDFPSTYTCFKYYNTTCRKLVQVRTAVDDDTRMTMYNEL